MSERISKERIQASIYTILSLIIICSIPFRTELALADSIKGILDFDYNNFEVEAKDETGQERKTDADSFVQQYRLTLSKNFYPNLQLNVGGIFDKARNTIEINDDETRSIITRTRPFADLTLRTPIYHAGLYYRKRDDKREVSNFPSRTDINEQYNVFLGWKPEGFPSLDMRYETTDTYDKDRLFRDVDRERALMTLTYVNENFDIRYQPEYEDVKNKIDDLEIEDTKHTGRLIYTDTFWEDRTTIYTSYNISYTEREITAGGQGEVSFQLFPLSGLSSLDDSPSQGELDTNPALIDGNLTVPSTVDIGLPTPPVGDTRKRNMGLDFFNADEVNTLFVWVDKELPPEVSNSYSWDIYTSDDNLNWDFLTTILAAPFGSFENRFEIRFPNKTARYIKAVVSPLSPAVVGAANFTNIFVTEIQAFLSRPSADVKGKTDRTTHIFSTDSRTRLLDIPTLYYEFSYSLSKASSSPRNSLLTNGFSLAHQFNEVFSGGARVAREDIDEPSSDGASYIYSASLRAVPFNTLSHTLLFSGRNDVLGDESVDRNSLFLQNRAHIYKGLDTFLHGGITKTTPEIGQDQDTTSWILGVSATPHRILTLTYNMDSRKTDSSGGGIPDETRTDRRRDLSLTYRPFQTVYVTGILSRVIEPDRKETLKNYTLNFSPFPDGALQINVFYSERLNTEDDGKSRSLNPSLRWNITNRAILEFSYQKIKNESDRGSSDLKTFNVNTRLIY